MARTPHELVMEWHTTYNVPVGNAEDPYFLTDERMKLRMDLIREEMGELNGAIKMWDFNETVDALADLVYVIYGMAIEMGVNLDLILDEVQRSNMSKLDENGNPIYREDGKVLKGPDFFPPDISKVLASDGYSL